MCAGGHLYGSACAGFVAKMQGFHYAHKVEAGTLAALQQLVRQTWGKGSARTV